MPISVKRAEEEAQSRQVPEGNAGYGRSEPGQTHQLKSLLLGGLAGRRRLVALASARPFGRPYAAATCLRVRRNVVSDDALLIQPRRELD
jgi:hypothetical protein